MKAETTRRLFSPAWAKALRWKCMRHLCQVVESSREVAALMPSWASLITSFTPPHEVLEELGRERFGFGGANGHALDLATPIGVDADRNG